VRVARHDGPVRALVLLLAAITAGYPLLLLVRSPIEADAQASVVAFLPLLLLPAVIAIVGLARSSIPLVGAAGALCMFPAIMTGFAVVPFAGFLAVAGLSRGPLPSGRELLRGIAVVVIGLAAWMVPYVGMDPFVPIDAPRIGAGIVMMVATIGLAIGGLPRRRAVGLAR